jgi:hypothetical protein
VEVRDCQEAMDILAFALYHEEDKKKRKHLEGVEEGEGRMEEEGRRGRSEQRSLTTGRITPWRLTRVPP